MTQPLDKSLPSNEDAEQVILGAILLDNSVADAALQSLRHEDFYSPLNRMYFESIKNLYQGSESIDPIKIGEEMKSRGIDPTNFGGVSSITNLTLGLPHFHNIDEYVKIVKEHSVARQVIRACNQITGALLAGQEAVPEVLAEAESSILKISTSLYTNKPQEVKGFWTLAEIAPEIMTQFENFNKGVSSGCPSGMPELDRMLDGGGFQGGGTYLVAAGEKVGKTSLALDWGWNGAVVENVTVPIITMEMSKVNLAKRLYSSAEGIPYFMFRPGFGDSATNKVYTKAVEGLTNFAKYPIQIADRLFGFLEIARHLRRVCEQAQKVGQPVKFAIIDYLQIITYDAGKTSNREREVAGISRGLKELAMELDIALIIMSNLNRTGLTEGQEPDTFNLRDSGTLAFDAEAVMFLHNPAYVPGKPYEPQKITDINLILSRQRNGPTGRIPLKFMGEYMQFMTESQYRKVLGGTETTLTQEADQDARLDALWGTD